MASGKKSHNTPTEAFILESPAPVDVAAKISSIYMGLSIQVGHNSTFALIIIKLYVEVLLGTKLAFMMKLHIPLIAHLIGKRSCE